MTDMVANVTNILPLATKNSGLVTTLATRFPYDLDLNKKSKGKTNIFCFFCRFLYLYSCSCLSSLIYPNLPLDVNE